MSLSTTVVARISVLAFVLTASGCAQIRANTATTQQLQETSVRESSDMEATKRAIAQALTSGQYAAITDWLTDDAVMVLPSADSIRSAVGIVNRMSALSAGRIESVGFQRVKATPCEQRAFEVGRYSITRRPSPFAPGEIIAGAYALHWRATAEGRLRLDRILLFNDLKGAARRYQPCTAMTGSLMLRRRFAVTVSPLTGQADFGTRAGLLSRAETQGWDRSTPNTRTNPPRPPAIGVEPLNAFVSVHARYLPFTVEAATSLRPVTGGAFTFNDSLDSGLTERFETREAFVVLSVARGRHRFGLGPSVVRTQWISMEERMGRFFPGPERWPASSPSFYMGPYTSRSTAVGVVTQYMFTKPITTREFFELGGRVRLISGGRVGPTLYYRGGDVGQSSAFIVASVGHVF